MIGAPRSKLVPEFEGWDWGEDQFVPVVKKLFREVLESMLAEDQLSVHLHGDGSATVYIGEETLEISFDIERLVDDYLQFGPGSEYEPTEEAAIARAKEAGSASSGVFRDESVREELITLRDVFRRIVSKVETRLGT